MVFLSKSNWCFSLTIITIIVNCTPTLDLVINKANDLAQLNNISPNHVFSNKYKTQSMNPLEPYLK